MTQEKHMDSINKSRRKFVIGSGVIMTSTALGLTLRSGQTYADSAQFVEPTIQAPQRAKGKMLVVYASMFGSTGQVAVTIGEELCKDGYAVDIRLPSHVTSLDGYAAVVVGSCVKGSAWLDVAVNFVKLNRQALSKVPVAYFLTCMRLAARDDEAAQRLVAGWLDPLRKDVPEVKPLSIGAFAGALDFKKLSAIQRVMYPIIAGNSHEGDFRNFNQIRTWSVGLRTTLTT
jgi:menaquinone-dependent protoporphyrinogen oxidase